MALADNRGDHLRVAPQEWVDLFGREYLSDYIPSGGSVVRVLSGSASTLAGVETEIRVLAEQGGFLYARLDPGELTAEGKRPDLHRIDRFFFQTTRNVDWKGSTAAQVRRYLEEQSIHVAPGRALNDLEGIAEDNGRDARDLLGQFQTRYATPLVRDPSQEIEFRTALTALSRAQIVPDSVTPTTEEVVLGWFKGMPGLAKELKKLHIYNRIGLANARHMLASFCRWLPRTGSQGIVTALDFRPYEHVRKSAAQRRIDTLDRLKVAVARGANHAEMEAILAEGEADPPISYSLKAYEQMLQLLRRFIDEIESFERFCLMVLTSPAYYDRSSERSYFDYDALQTRIGLEVHDVGRANPLAALAHLEDER